MAMPSIQSEVKSVTPHDAKMWLQADHSAGRNRRPQVNAYADDMAAERWVLNGDPIILSDAGKVLSGVLRLQACMKANVPFQSLVIRGVSDETYETIDSVRRRTLADILTIRQEDNGRALAASLTILWRYAKEDYIRLSQTPSAKVLLGLLENNPDIRTSMKLAADAAKLMSLGVVTAMHYLFSRVDTEKANEFFQALTDEEVTDGTAYLLRRQLAAMKEDRGTRSQPIVIALFIKAWEAFRTGEERSQLRFAPGTERAPLISDLDPTSLLEGLSAPQPVNAHSPSVSPTVTPNTLTVEVVEITPERAEDLLGHNEQNRGVAALVVDKYTRDMKAGKWALNGQTIKIGKTGRLLDGQHRLMACAKAGQSFPAIIVSGLEEDVFETFDLGARRSIGEILKDKGELNTSALGAALRQLWLLENGFFMSRGAAPTVAELLGTLERHPDLRNSIRHGRRVMDVTAPTLVVALHYLFSRVNQHRADEYVERLIDGADLFAGHPILVLRDQLMKAKAKKKTGLPDAERAAWMIKAWNAYMTDRTVGRIKFQQIGPRREEFPAIWKYGEMRAQEAA